jgi:hypothetical protein
MKNEAAFCRGLNRLDAALGKNFDIRPAGRVGQTVDDGLGGVGDWKHPSIGFGF